MTRHDWLWTASGRLGSAGMEIADRHRGDLVGGLGDVVPPAGQDLGRRPGWSTSTPAKATIGPSGWASKSKWVTTPKLPPPPRSAQNRSGSFSADATWTEPSAQTTVAERRLSMVSPYLRRTQPSPPPRVRPPTPVSDTTPPGTTSPNACVSRSTSPRPRRPGRRPAGRSGRRSRPASG